MFNTQTCAAFGKHSKNLQPIYFLLLTFKRRECLGDLGVDGQITIKVGLRGKGSGSQKCLLISLCGHGDGSSVITSLSVVK
jgi:hypothetical protein